MKNTNSHPHILHVSAMLTVLQSTQNQKRVAIGGLEIPRLDYRDQLEEKIAELVANHPIMKRLKKQSE